MALPELYMYKSIFLQVQYNIVEIHPTVCSKEAKTANMIQENRFLMMLETKAAAQRIAVFLPLGQSFWIEGELHLSQKMKTYPRRRNIALTVQNVSTRPEVSTHLREIMRITTEKIHKDAPSITLCFSARIFLYSGLPWSSASVQVW